MHCDIIHYDNFNCIFFRSRLFLNVVGMLLKNYEKRII